MNSLTPDSISKLLATTIPSFQLTCEDSLNLGFGFIFYGLARTLRPRHVVVIGSKAGFAPVCFALALKDNVGHTISSVGCGTTCLSHPQERGLVSFIDPSYSIHRGDIGHSYGIGTWDTPSSTTTIFEDHGVASVVTHYKMTSATYLQTHTNDGGIDLLYIDGDHSYEGIMHDLTEFRPHLNPGAFVLAHDVAPDLEDSEGHEVLRDLPEGMYDVVTIPISPGLAIMRPCDGQ